jgi:hypothetical protein
MALSDAQAAELARKHGFSEAAVRVAAEALVRGRGSMAQFQHADFGGPGQWLSGGMLMIGDMFNHALKARVAALFEDLTRLPAVGMTPTQAAPMNWANSAAWWPAELGQPGSSGGQNGIRYAYFPAHRKLVVEQGGRIKVYETGEHVIGGFSQAQGATTELLFHTAQGVFPVSSLPESTPR